MGRRSRSRGSSWTPHYLLRDCPLYLLGGWTGDFADPYNFLGTWFATESTEWGFNNPEVFDAIAAANTEPDQATAWTCGRPRTRP